jgi:hypothetical protein
MSDTTLPFIFPYEFMTVALQTDAHAPVDLQQSLLSGYFLSYSSWLKLRVIKNQIEKH